MSKVVVITGTSSGIGLTLGNFLVEKGYQVFGLSRSLPENANFQTIITDVTQLDSCISAFQQIEQEVGAVDVLVNNAGKGMVGAIENATDDDVLSLFQLNLLGSIHCIKAVLPIFRNQTRGQIINISSIGSVMGLPFRGYYSASKSALDQCTEALRYEVNDFGVQACVLHLGDIKTSISESRIQTKVSPYYEQNFQKVYSGMNAHVDEGSSPESVAIYIEKLLRKKSFKPHYYFGKPMQKFSITLKKFLPQKWFEKMIKYYAGL